jgi:G3E family GTPase
MSTAHEEKPARLPVTVIGGFLGTGKTTLLNRLLHQSEGRRLAVLVNDFGALNIDAELIAANAGDTIALSNGCVCCSIGDDLTAALIRVIESPLPFDAVLIEASGVSDPWRIAQVGLADPGLSLDGALVLVDAGACLAHAVDPLLADSLLRQLEAADLLVVNKTDLVDANGLQKVRDWLALASPGTPCFEPRQARVPMALLSGAALPISGQIQAESGGHNHEHPGAKHGRDFETWSCRPARVFPAAALRGLLRAMPAGVLRLKGIVRSDEHGWAELQFAGRHGSLRRASATPANGSAIVAIGLRDRLPVAAMRAALADNPAPCLKLSDDV